MSTQSIASIYTNQIVSGFDVHKPEKLAQIFKRYGDQSLSFFVMLMMMGFELPVAQVEYSHFEENRFHETFIVRDPVGAPGAGNDLVITLDPASVDANNDIYPRLWDSVLMPNETVGKIVNINQATPSAPILTIRPNLTTDDLGAVVAGQELVISSAAFSEGSGQPKGALSKLTEIFNQTQIIKESIGYTGTEMTNQTWVRIDGMDGAPYYMKGQGEMDYRMSLKIDGALLFEKPTNNPNMIDPATNRPVVTTQGLIPAIRERGNTLLNSPGTWTVQRFDELDRIADREGGPVQYLGLLGLPFFQEINNSMATFFKDTNIEFARKSVVDSVFKGNEAMAAMVNFKTLQKNDRVFSFKTMGQFTNPKVYGAAGYPMPNFGVFLPLGTATDAKTKAKIPTIGVRVKKWGSTNRKMEIFKIGGAGPVKVNDLDLENSYMRSNIGAQHANVNQYILVSPS